MSTAGSGPTREVAYRIFAAEFDASSVEVSEGEAERAPNYVISPTGARINRLFLVGVVTEVEWVNDDVIRGRVADPTGAFVLYAGQYQPDSLASLERLDPPAVVAVTGKANTFQPEGSERVFTSVRPESLNDVDAETRDRWIVETAEHTLARVDRFAAALEMGVTPTRTALVRAGFPEADAHGIAVAAERYGTTPGYLLAVRAMAIDALRMVAGERDTVRPPTIEPDGPGEEPPLEALRLPAEHRFEPEEGRNLADGSRDAEGLSVEEETNAIGDDPSSDEAASTARPAALSSEKGADAASDSGAPDGVDNDAEPAEAVYELDEEERASVEEDFGTEFTTGAEVGPPASADEAPSDGDEQPDSASAEPESEPPDEPSDTATTSSTGAGPATDQETPGTDDDLEDVVMETMRSLATDEPVDRPTLIDRVAGAQDVPPEAVEDALQDALMSGRCYEPEEGRLRPI